MRNYNEPPEPIECNPENYNFHDCYFCVNREDCKKEYEDANNSRDNESIDSTN